VQIGVRPLLLYRARQFHSTPPITVRPYIATPTISYRDKILPAIERGEECHEKRKRFIHHF
jgi:hypothetical protein